MLVDGRRTLVESVKVEINPLDVFKELFRLWRYSVCDKADGIRNGKWYREDGDYHSDWENVIREATEEEISKYKAFIDIWGIITNEGFKK